MNTSYRVLRLTGQRRKQLKKVIQQLPAGRLRFFIYGSNSQPRMFVYRDGDYDVLHSWTVEWLMLEMYSDSEAMAVATVEYLTERGLMFESKAVAMRFAASHHFAMFTPDHSEHTDEP